MYASIRPQPCFAVPAMLAVLLSAPTGAQERDRAKIPDKYKWNVADIYPTEDAWRKAKDSSSPRFLQLRRFKGTLGAVCRPRWPTHWRLGAASPRSWRARSFTRA